MVDITGADENGMSGAKEGEKVGGGGGGLNISTHIVGGREDKKCKAKGKTAEEEEKGEESQGWRYYPMYDDRTLSDMMRDMIVAAAAMEEAKEKGMKGSAYRDWVEMINRMIIERDPYGGNYKGRLHKGGRVKPTTSYEGRGRKRGRGF